VRLPNLIDMARPARNRIELSDEERSALKRIARAALRRLQHGDLAAPVEDVGAAA
jgi:hypothetical protein